MTTDGSGNAAFDNTFSYSAPVNSYVSSTATDLTTGDTSEFSNAKLVSVATAASVSIAGRVTETFGRGVSGARVALTDSNGNIRYAMTNFFGYFRFTQIAAGETYILTATHKRYEFFAQIVSVNDDRDDINFVGDLRLWKFSPHSGKEKTKAESEMFFSLSSLLTKVSSLQGAFLKNDL